MSLVLQAVDVRGPTRWWWLLTDEATGNLLADQQVALDPDAPEVRGFGDVYRYVRSYAAPDRRAEDEARLVAELGVWAGRVLLGPAIGEAIAAAAPVTVRVSVPASLRHVLGWPLELAHVAGAPLAALGDRKSVV